MKSLLETADLRKTYTVGKIQIEALRGVDLRIREGELVAIMGPSGCGKSTLMHVLGAMTKPTAGKVVIDGQEISGMGDNELTRIRRDKIGFVFQKFNLLPTLTAGAKIDIARYIPANGVRSNGHEQHLREILQVLMNENKKGRKPSELSRARQPRFANPRAGANQPDLRPAAEPT